MQGRKIISMQKVKPKLLLDKGRFSSITSQHQEQSSPIFIAQIKQSKQNLRRSSKQAEARSLCKQRCSSSYKSTNINIRSVLSVKRDSQELKSLREITPATQPSTEQKVDLEDFLHQFVSKLLLSSQVFHFSGDLTLSCTLLTRIARIIIEEIGYSPHQLNNIIRKIELLTGWIEEQKREEDEDMRESSREKKAQGNTKILSLAIVPQANLRFAFEGGIMSEEASKRPQPSPPSQQQAVSPVLTSSEAFIFAHLSELDNFIMQQPNKILHEAVRRHKYLEEELFAYADMLSISRIGANTYTPQANICFLEATLDREMRELNRELVQGNSSLESKGRMLRDYVLRVREGFATVVAELMRVIDCKTELAKTFVSKVLKWEENYLARKEYLSNLKRDYCKELHALTTALASQRQGGVIAALDVVEESLAAIHRIFLLGNSFY